MQKNGLGRIWSVLSPLVLRYAIAYVAEFIVVGIYMFTQMNIDFGTLQTQEEIYEQMEIVLEAIVPYST